MPSRPAREPLLLHRQAFQSASLVLKRCKKPDDVLFINASGHFEQGKRQSRLLPEHIDKIVSTYQFRQEDERYA